jgi:predicted small lipoprotein YifL
VVVKRAVAAALVAIALAGCAAPGPRILMPDAAADQAKVIEQCQPRGCYAIPVEFWEHLINMLRASGFIVEAR